MKKISAFISILFLAAALLMPAGNAMADAFTTSTAQLTFNSSEIKGNISIEPIDEVSIFKS